MVGERVKWNKTDGIGVRSGEGSMRILGFGGVVVRGMDRFGDNYSIYNYLLIYAFINNVIFN